MRESLIQIENGKEFLDFVNDYIKGPKDLKDLKIKYINLCFDLKNYMKFRDDYEECKRKIFQVEHNPYNAELNNLYRLHGNNIHYFEFYLYKIGLYLNRFSLLFHMLFPKIYVFVLFKL